MNQQAKTKRSFPYVAIILWVTVVLAVIILGYTLMDSIGLTGRMNTAAKSDNIRLNENQMDVYRYHVAQNDLYYQYMYVLYGLADDPTGGLIQYMDASTFINYMLPSTVGTGNYDETAYAYAEQYLTYCEGAMAAGLYDEYKAEIEADIDEYIEGLETSAEANGITFSSYRKNFIGTGVSKGDIKTAMEYYFIGGKYAEKLADDYADAVTDDEIVQYRDDNKANFYSTTYSYYTLVSNTMKEDIEACTSIDEVKTVIVDYYMDQKFETLYEANFTNNEVEDTAGKEQTMADVRATLLAMNGIGDNTTLYFVSTDTDAYKAAAYAIVKDINSSVSAQTFSETTATWADPEDTSATDLQKWLFGDGRKEGDHKLIETTSTSTSSDGTETTTTTYKWYIVEEDVMVLDEEHTKNAHYILLTDDGEDVENGKTAKEKAEAFHAALTATNTAEKFEDLVKEYAPGYSSALFEHISYDDMASTYEDLADWLYEDGRKEGDVSDMIEVKEDDEVTGYIIALYMGENEETWKVNATEAIAGERLTDWYNEAVEKYHVVIDYSHDEETSAA